MPPDSLNPNLNDGIAKFPVESESEQASIIPPTVAVSDKIVDYENQKIVFTFLPYKHNNCEICKLSESEARRLTKQLQRVNQTLRKHIFTYQASGIECKRVYKKGEYDVLYEDLPRDTELLEVDFTNNGGRIFGYLVENIFNIILIKQRHFKCR